jgi:probable sporulation protein (polysaccharide deacetylase family)
MRYRLFTVLRAPKVLFTILILFLMLLAVNHFRPTFRRTSTIGDGVSFAGRDLSGLTAAEAKIVIEQAASILNHPPIDSKLDPATNGVIPGLNGLAVDVEETLARALAAQENETVKPVYQQVEAALSLTHFPEKPIYRGNPAKSEVAFLINVAWGNEYLEELLAVLKEEQAEATFFLVGRWVQANKAEARLLAESGFELGNHGFSDALSMQELSFEAAAADISKAAAVIEEVCGKRPVYFSPHRGELSEEVLQAAASFGNRTIMWTVDTVDWKLPGVAVMLEKILSQAEGGSLILMHPTEQTADFLRQVIPALRAKGLEPVSLSKLLSPLRTLKE